MKLTEIMEMTMQKKKKPDEVELKKIRDEAINKLIDGEEVDIKQMLDAAGFQMTPKEDFMGGPQMDHDDITAIASKMVGKEVQMSTVSQICIYECDAPSLDREAWLKSVFFTGKIIDYIPKYDARTRGGRADAIEVEFTNGDPTAEYYDDDEDDDLDCEVSCAIIMLEDLYSLFPTMGLKSLPN